MQTVQTQQNLKGELLSLGGADSSFSLAILRGRLDAHTLLSVRQAEYVCDFTVVLAFFEMTDKEKAILKQAGVNILLTPEKAGATPPVHINTGVEGVDATLVLQTILNVMPMVVSVTPMDLPLLETCIRLEKTFEGLFSLLSKETPMELLNTHQQNVRQLSLLAQDLVKSGEGDIAFLKSAVQKGADRYGYNVTEIRLFDDHLNVPEGSIPPVSGLITLCLERLGEKTFDTIRFEV